MNINYKSDFPLRFRPVDDDGQPLPLPSCPWQIWLTVGNPFTLGSDKFIASFDGTNFSNCRVADGTVLVFANNHGLPTGRLWVTFATFMPSPDFPDGKMCVYTPRPSDISLVSGAGDGASDADIDVLANYIPVPYDDTALTHRIDGLEALADSRRTLIISAFSGGHYRSTRCAWEKGFRLINNKPYSYSPLDSLFVRFIHGQFNPDTDRVLILRYGRRKSRIGDRHLGFAKCVRRGWAPLTSGGRRPLPVRTGLVPVFGQPDRFEVRPFEDANSDRTVSLAQYVEDNLIDYQSHGSAWRLYLSHIGCSRKTDVDDGSIDVKSVSAPYGIAVFRALTADGSSRLVRISNIATFNVVVAMDADQNIWIRFT